MLILSDTKVFLVYEYQLIFLREPSFDILHQFIPIM